MVSSCAEKKVKKEIDDSKDREIAEAILENEPSDHKENTALVVLDIQNDYFPGGTMELVGAKEAAAKAKKVLNHFRESKMSSIT